MGDDPLASTNYRTLTPIGKGGMGEVVLAEHRALGKQVVVKILHAKYAQDPRIATRTEIEARSLAALKSPFIVDVLDFGQTPEGRTFLVMEHLVGRTLGAELRARGFLPVREAIGYVIDVLSALELAHEKGIIHRDIKGDNIFLCDGSPRTVKVLDFGIAKVLDVPEGISRPALPKLETEEGGFIGTPRNFAPEQALGRKVDGRTDVYSTGLLLYTLIAGQGPFAHLKAGMDLLRAHTTERPAAPSVSAKQVVPAAVDAAVLLSLEKKPADRFQSARAFADALRAVLAELPSDSDAAALEDATLVYAPNAASQSAVGPRPQEGGTATTAPLPDVAQSTGPKAPLALEIDAINTTAPALARPTAPALPFVSSKPRVRAAFLVGLAVICLGSATAAFVFRHVSAPRAALPVPDIGTSSALAPEPVVPAATAPVEPTVAEPPPAAPTTAAQPQPSTTAPPPRPVRPAPLRPSPPASTVSNEPGELYNKRH